MANRRTCSSTPRDYLAACNQVAALRFAVLFSSHAENVPDLVYSLVFRIIWRIQHHLTILHHNQPIRVALRVFQIVRNKN